MYHYRSVKIESDPNWGPEVHMAVKKKKARQKPFWERGYKGHAYWLGKHKLGKVTLVAHAQYDWEAAGKRGRSDTLERARAAVEFAVAMADKQLSLFD